MTNDELKRASALVALNTMTVEEGEILKNFRQNRFISSYRS